MANEELNTKPAEQEDLEIKPVEQEVKEEELKEVNGGFCYGDFFQGQCFIDIDPEELRKQCPEYEC